MKACFSKVDLFMNYECTKSKGTKVIHPIKKSGSDDIPKPPPNYLRFSSTMTTEKVNYKVRVFDM